MADDRQAMRNDDWMNPHRRALLKADLMHVQSVVSRAKLAAGDMSELRNEFHAVVGLLDAYATLVRTALEQDLSPIGEQNLVNVDPKLAEYIGEKIMRTFGGYMVRSSVEAREAFLTGMGFPVNKK